MDNDAIFADDRLVILSIGNIPNKTSEVPNQDGIGADIGLPEQINHLLESIPANRGSPGAGNIPIGAYMHEAILLAETFYFLSLL